jgi:dephospho-CoA kinase
MKKNLIIGLTGGIACGKTTVARLFQNFGADVIDADSVGHQLLREDLSVKKKLVATFGASILDSKNEIDRLKLGHIVFNSPDQLQALNKIVHPPIIERIKADVAKKSSSAEKSIIVIDAALLLELDLTYMVDFVVLVHADENIQMQRLMKRGLSYEDARRRINSQMPSHEKTRFVDFVIYNNGSLSNAAKQAEEVWRALTELLDP